MGSMINARIWYHDQALHTQSNAVELEIGGEELDASTFPDTTKVRAGGAKEVAAQVEGLWASAQDAQMFAQVGARQAFMVSDGPTVGNVAYGFKALDVNYKPIASGEWAQLLRFSISLSNSDNAGLVRGQLMFNAAIAASGNGTARQLGLVAAGEKMYGGLHVTAFDGTTLDVILQSDDAEGMGTPTGRITFTQATGLTSEWASVAGAIANDDWWRANYTFVGTSATFALFAGIL